MRNKVLIVDANQRDREELEQILLSVVEEGGELLFADKREDGLTLIAGELPQLVFLDTHLIGENGAEWVKKGVHVVIMRKGRPIQQTGEDFVVKPFKPHQVLEKCRAVLGKEPVRQLPPM